MGNAESNPVRNLDKRTARRQYRKTFEKAIMAFRVANDDIAISEPKPANEGNGLQVYVRKRPIFPRELEAEFDVITCSPTTVTIHDARMEADMRHQFLRHHRFVFDSVFGAAATNAEVYDCAVAPLVECALLGGHATCFMYGQTGSGKTFTMSSVHSSLCAVTLSR